MFIRKQTINGADYYRVVESYRHNGKVKTRTLVSLGRSNNIEEVIAEQKEVVQFWQQQVDFFQYSRSVYKQVGYIEDEMLKRWNLPFGSAAEPHLERHKPSLRS